MFKLIGILNLTPDSFSDGGIYNNSKDCYARVESMIEDGVDIIDVGAESTRPFGAAPITEQEEWSRLENFLPRIIDLAHGKDVKVSLDSRNYKTSKKAVDLGVDILNEQTAFEDENYFQLMQQNKHLQAIIMHSLKIPEDRTVFLPEDTNIIEYLKDWIENKSAKFKEQNIDDSRVIFDVGLGFGKTLKQQIELVDKAHELSSQFPNLCFGHSRKSFIGKLTNIDVSDRDLETLLISQFLIRSQVRYLRIHDVFSHNRMRNLNKKLTEILGEI